MLRPCILGMRGSIVIRLRPCMNIEYPPPPPDRLSPCTTLIVPPTPRSPDIFARVYRPLFPLEPLVTGVLAASGSASPLPPSHYPQSSTHGGVGDLALDGGTLDVLRRSVTLYIPCAVRYACCDNGKSLVFFSAFKNLTYRGPPTDKVFLHGGSTMCALQRCY